MKTSFSIALSFLIMYLLCKLHTSNANSIYNNNFSIFCVIFSLALAFGITWILNRCMPKTIAYVKATKVAPILENIFSNDTQSFIRRLRRSLTFHFSVAFFFIIGSIVALFAIWHYPNSFGYEEVWIAFIIFTAIAINSTTCSFRLMKSVRLLELQPTTQTCIDVATNYYHLDYASYHNAREEKTPEQTLPTQPCYYLGYLFINSIASIICILAALLALFFSFLFLHGDRLATNAEGLFLLTYGCILIYIGFRDILSHRWLSLISDSKDECNPQRP